MYKLFLLWENTEHSSHIRLPWIQQQRILRKIFLGQSYIAILKKNLGYNSCPFGVVHINCLLFLERLTLLA